MIKEMIEGRYFFYIVALNMLSNVIMFSPRILLQEKFSGAVSSILLAVPVGLGLLALLVYAVRQFPEQTLPEILATAFPKWLRLAVLIHLILMWYLAGGVTLISISEITSRFILPESGRLQIVALFSVLALLTIRMRSDQLLRGVESLFLIIAPLIVLILGKSVFEPTLSWRAIAEVGTHANQMPTIASLSAATFIYTGYLNLVIFNRTIHGSIGKLMLSVIAFLGLLTLLTSFFIPIGIHGTYAVDDFMFPWVFTADALHMELFFIERVLFPFLLLYIIIALLSMFIHWHVGYEIIKSTFSIDSQRKKWLVLGLFAAGAVSMHSLLQVEQNLADFAHYWMIARFLSEIALVGILVYAARRKKPA